MTHTEAVQTRVDAATLRWIEKQASAEGLSVASWLRRLILREKKS